MKTTFRKISDSLYGTEISKRRTDIYGKKFNALEACRAIKEEEGWRIDFSGNMCGTWLPWEPINTTVFPTAKEAMKAISDYART